MDFGAILSDTWKITWKNKVFWILGILAGCSASGRGSNAQSVSGFQGWNFDSTEFPSYQFENVPELENFFNNINEGAIVAWVFALICIFFFLSLVFLVLGVIGQGGLIAGFGQADQGNTVTLGEAFSFGIQNFWKLLGIRLLVWIAGAVVAVIAIILLIGVAIFTLGLGLICLIPLICLLIPLSFGVDAYITLTMIAAVEEELGVFDAFGRAWEVVKAHFGEVLIMGLVLIVGGGIVGVIIAAPFLGVGLPALIGTAIGDDPAILTGIGVSAVLLICAFPIFLLVQGILTTYITGAWTLTFRRLTGKGALVVAEESV
jgi:hypothetical protein